MKMKPVDKLTDDELFDEIREQVNRARFTPGLYNRERTQQIGAEMTKRGWNNKGRNDEQERGKK